MARPTNTKTVEVPPVHNRIKELREAAGLRRIDLAHRYRVYPTTVRRWEQGGTVPDDVKRDLVQLLEERLERAISVEYLMGWDVET